MASSRPPAGFTLLEVLVVLVITSMLSLLLMDGVGQVLQIEQRMGERTRVFRTTQLQQHWVRQLIAGARASRDHPFELSPTSLRGLTLSPLASGGGVPTPFELSLINLGEVTELRYREGEGDAYTLMQIDNRELVNPVQFRALDARGTYVGRWQSKQDGPQWPAGLALSIPALDGEELWHVAVLGRRTPRPQIDDQLGI